MHTIMPTLPPLAWLLLGTAALIVGFSKTALPGSATLAVAIFAAVLPAKQSTGALLLLLIAGDICAIYSYHRQANWATILKLTPTVIIGLICGWLYMSIAGDTTIRRTIAIILLALTAFTVWRRSRKTANTPVGTGKLATLSYGTLAGFTTMVANAAGPVMSMYFLLARFPVTQFLGTAAWFFAAINLAKLPFAGALGLLPPNTLLLDGILLPAVLLGAVLGKKLVSRIPQRHFDAAVLVITIAGALYLLT